MNELTLSDDLIEISAEINIYKQQAGQAVFEIGRRLKHVKENDLAHGQWAAFLQSIDIEQRTAQRLIQAFEQFGNATTSSLLPVGKIFEMLSLPESIDRQEFAEKAHTIPSTGETKTVDDMTVLELRDVKKALKEAEISAANGWREAQQWKQAAQSQPTKTVTKTVEVTPPDYNEIKRQAATANMLNTENVQLKRAQETMRETYEEKLSAHQKKDYAKKDLQKYLSEQLRAIGMNHDSAIFNYTEIQGDREAYDIVMRFLTQYESIVKQQFKEWEQITAIRAVN